jgi:hypothetical protein
LGQFLANPRNVNRIIVDISKFKLELYDILAVLVPGFVLLCSVWILLRGWSIFLTGFMNVSAAGFTAILLLAFPLGHLIQELGDTAYKGIFGERYFKSARDLFWKQDDGIKIRQAIMVAVGFDPSIDTAFDFCLSKTKDLFTRRDAFLATSDLSRSLFVLGFLSLPTLGRVLLEAAVSIERRIVYGVVGLLAWTLFLYLSHRRMCPASGFFLRSPFLELIWQR